MGYVGNQQTEGYSQIPAKQDLTGATGTSLTLTHAVASAEGIDLYINNVRQEPTEAYSVVGTAVTLTGSVVASDDIYVVYNSLALQTTVPPDASVSTAKIIDGDVTMDKLATSGTLPALDGSALTGIGGMTLLSTNSISGASTSVNVTATGYNYLMFHIYGLDAAAGYEASIRFNSDSGSNYKWARISEDANGAAGPGGGTTTSFHLGQTGAAGFSSGNTNNNAIMRVYFPNGTAHWKSCEWSSIQDTGTDDVQIFQSGHWRDNSAITSVQVVCTSSTFTDGTIDIYGVK